MMLDTDVYERAFQFGRTQIWKKLYEDDLFAVQLSGGRIGYCNVMGSIGEHFAVSLYIGEEGLRSFYSMRNAAKGRSSHYRAADMLIFDCFQCSLESGPSTLCSAATVEKGKVYAREHNMSLPGELVPVFQVFRKYSQPYAITLEQDMDDMAIAIDATLYVDGQIGQAGKEKTGMWDNGQIPFLIPAADGFERQSLPRPSEDGTQTFASPTRVDDVLLGKLTSLPRKGTLECDIIRSAMMVADEHEGYHPAGLMVMDRKSGKMLGCPLAGGRLYNPDEMLYQIMADFIRIGICPKEICVRKKETVTVLKPLCERARITLRKVSQTPLVEYSLFRMDQFFLQQAEMMR